MIPNSRAAAPADTGNGQMLKAASTPTVAPVSDTDPARLADVLAALEFAPSLTPTEALARLDGSHALFVVSRDPRGHVRRRCYLNLPSAEAALTRAEARGDVAHVVLVRMAAVGTVLPAGGDE